MQQENLGQSISLWMATTAVPNQSTLVEDTHTEFEQRAAYFDGDLVIATKKGVNNLVVQEHRRSGFPGTRRRGPPIHSTDA